MAANGLFLSFVILLLASCALAQRGPPGGEPHGPPLNLTAVGNMTADVSARLANCSADQTFLDGRFHLTVFKNASGNYNLVVGALLVAATGAPPDSLAIVQGAVCDASAAALLALPVAASAWQQRAGWWLLHAEARLDAFLENADAATVDALLALLPTASLPPRTNSTASQPGWQQAAGSRRMGIGAGGLLTRAVGQRGQQQQGAQKPPAGGLSGGFPGAGGVNATVSGYAVLASASDVLWGGQLMGVKLPSAAA